MNIRGTLQEEGKAGLIDRMGERVAPERNNNAFSGDPIWSSNNPGQVIDGIGQM